MRPGTLSLRLFLLTSVWALVSVGLIAFVLSEAYRANAERRFAELVTANLYNLMGSVQPGEDGRLVERSTLRDPRYASFGSGWYWSVESLRDRSNRVASASLVDREIAPPEGLRFDDTFQRVWNYVDEGGQQITAVEARAFLGSGDEIFSFRVTGDRGEISEEIGGFTRTMVLLLALFGLGFVLASFVIVTIGLRPVSEATRRLADIREGRAERLEGMFPREIQPLIDETNALIQSNRSVIERARTQVGNLAHSLKTPLAVLNNEAREAPGELGRIILEQTGLMQHQVQAYLDRARIAARHGTVTSRTAVGPVLDRLVRVVSKLNPQIALTSGVEPRGLVFAGEQQDFEEVVGNLLENGARFAANNLSVKAIAEGNAAWLTLLVEDDGPGLSEDQAKEALKRGARLDETTPGSGLGLSIVKDIVSEYGGTIVLGRSPMGGLEVRIRLPARSSGQTAG